MFQIHQTYIRSGNTRDEFRNLLACAFKRREAHHNTKTIIEQRVLA